ncbi:MAG: YabP/YqfC family sporulation protein [Lachnospiraceae bacterium]|nr:YabP/YqfC family sporulation protein [Lachnospiraceae bacterium]
MEQRLHFMKEQFASSMDIPRDLAFGDTLITIIGNSRLTIENYRGLYEYTPNTIQLLTRQGMLHVFGKSLIISFYTEDEMQISGYVKEIVFVSDSSEG